MKLARDLVVLAVLGGAIFFYKHRSAPPPPQPTFAGSRPNLEMPARAPGLRPAAPAESLLVTPESRQDAPRRLNGKPVVVPPLGQTPDLLSGSRSDAPAAEPSAVLGADRPSWLERLGTPQGLVAIAAVFAVCWVLLSRALRRGPGGRGYTHD